ncbi:MAG: O-phosphoseryl-tRNA(Sec) selenium transferase [Candidatus Lokiarchaeota archaeon]|nr:O-phosphoseryl-tRNA(Sec) selenium transferase [Candidatus Lokiarchaeota archaeon]
MLDRKKILEMLETFPIASNMVQRGMVGLQSFIKPMEIVLTQRTIPEKGWSDTQIRFFLEFLANLDSNNDPQAMRIGEREARVSTPILYDLTAGFIHGIGRSGNLKAAQPKAVGGSILNSLSDSFALNILKKHGLKSLQGAMTVPMGTGMTLMLAIKGILHQFSELTNKTQLIFPRMDHNSPRKAIELTGLENVTIESIYGKSLLDNYRTLKKNKYIEDYIKFIETHGTDAVYIPIQVIRDRITKKTFGVLSTTSFFPPRAPDNIIEIAKLAKEHNIAHIINNGYGVQSTTFMKMIEQAMRGGRVDAIVQSTDKNFLTPVGGAIIASPNKETIRKISEAYAGRANAAPILHFVVSMLSLGLNGFQQALQAQEENRSLLELELNNLAIQLNEMVLDVHNPIACMMSLKNLTYPQIEALGGFLYNLRVTGPRVVNPKTKDFGPSTQSYPHPYIVMNAAIGSRREDIIGAISNLKKAYLQVQQKFS